MNNIFRFVVIVVGIMLVITTGIIAYYLHTLSADIQYIHELNKQEIYKTYKQEYEYQCKRFYLFSDGKIDYLWGLYMMLTGPEEERGMSMLSYVDLNPD